MTGTTTAGPQTRVFGALLVFVLVVAAVPHCAITSCGAMAAKGPLPIAAPPCSPGCEDRSGIVATSPKNLSSDPSFTLPLPATFVTTTAKVDPPAALWSSQDGQRGDAPESVAIYLRDRSMLV